MSSNKTRIGVYFPKSKFDKMNFQTFVDYVAGRDDIELTLADPTKSLDTYDFHVFLHKVTDELTKGDERGKQIIENIEKYFRTHPHTVNIDPVENQRTVLDRSTMSILLDAVQSKLPSEVHFKNPRYLIIDREQPVYDMQGVSFPVVCKTVQACGASHAHKMGIVFHERALHEFTPPLLVQEFFNHDATVYKVFVIGNYHHVVKRPSLPNLPPALKDTILFDSQLPLGPQVEKALKGQLSEQSSQLSEASIPENTLQHICTALREVLGLHLFGFDVITNNETGQHAVIDVNYFPGYAGVANFDQILLDFLISTLK